MIAAGIEYLEAGQGPTVIFLHGIGGGAASFQAQLDGLSGFGCIAWNMPGYGRSKPSVKPLSFKYLSERLAGFLDELGLQKVHLVGQSIGGMLALEHAVRSPEQISTLSLIGTTPSFGGRDESFKEAFLDARLSPLDNGVSMEQLAARSAPNIVGTIADEVCITEVEHIMARIPATTWRNILQCLVTFNRRDNLGQIMQPCCLIAGSHDKNAPARTMEKMAMKLPVAEYHLVEGAGHMINQEAPNQTNSILSNFLGMHAV